MIQRNYQRTRFLALLSDFVSKNSKSPSKTPISSICHQNVTIRRKAKKSSGRFDSLPPGEGGEDVGREFIPLSKRIHLA